MSTPGEGPSAPFGQSGAGGEGGLDLESLTTAMVSLEWVAAVVGAVALLLFQMSLRALRKAKRGRQEMARFKYRHMQPADEDDDDDDDDDEDDDYGDYEEDEDEDDDDYDYEEEDDEDEDEDEEEEEEEEKYLDSVEGAEAAGPYFPESRVLETEAEYKLAYFFRDLMMPKSLPAKEATEYKYENSSAEAEKPEPEEEKEEENKDGELGERPKKDLD